MVGITKEIDRLGRIVIPKELRERYKLDSDVEIIATDKGILLRNSKYILVQVCDENDKKSKSGK